MSIRIEAFEEQIKDHMESQPYKLTCAECGADLEFYMEMDKDFDISIEVFRCKCKNA